MYPAPSSSSSVSSGGGVGGTGGGGGVGVSLRPLSSRASRLAVSPSVLSSPLTWPWPWWCCDSAIDTGVNMLALGFMPSASSCCAGLVVFVRLPARACERRCPVLSVTAAADRRCGSWCRRCCCCALWSVAAPSLAVAADETTAPDRARDVMLRNTAGSIASPL